MTKLNPAKVSKSNEVCFYSWFLRLMVTRQHLKRVRELCL